MKTKQKFFLIDYPEEDVKKKEKEETKKQAAFQYEIEIKNQAILYRIFDEGKIGSDRDRQDKFDLASSISPSGKGKNQLLANREE